MFSLFVSVVKFNKRTFLHRFIKQGIRFEHLLKFLWLRLKKTYNTLSHNMENKFLECCIQTCWWKAERKGKVWLKQWITAEIRVLKATTHVHAWHELQLLYPLCQVNLEPEIRESRLFGDGVEQQSNSSPGEALSSHTMQQMNILFSRTRFLD